VALARQLGHEGHEAGGALARLADAAHQLEAVEHALLLQPQVQAHDGTLLPSPGASLHPRVGT
jgi:hypothetical protein